MKKALIFLIPILLLCSCTPGIAASGGVVIHGELPKPTGIISYYKNEDIVYVTKSGKKYHNEGCTYLKSSKIMISLEQAIMEGKQPCSKCFGSKQTS
jgi:hypothetical protein